jgi:phosphoribosylaminoimidazole-succinocarboxamide synthase
MGSVKDLKVDTTATAETTGRGTFTFTDDYSVFDYGKMPDGIPGKGEALCRMSAYNFKELEKRGIKTHFLGMPSGNQMEVSLTRVLYPQKNEISAGEQNYLVPLEVIFRNSLPKGSSVFKRLDRGQTTYQELGLDRMPTPGEQLEKPIIDYSTKLEETDRYLTVIEAMELARISEEQLIEIKETALKINEFLNEKAQQIGLEHADGKVEFALFPGGQLTLVDVLGTLDEDRFLFNGFHLSKQVLRDYYKTTPWADEFYAALDKGIPKPEWPAPPRLPQEVIDVVANLYKSACEEWTGEKTFNAPSIEESVHAYKAFLEK